MTILMPGGRPTTDPKETLVAVRFSERQLVVLQRRARQDGTGLSEAIRRCVDEWAVSRPARAGRPQPKPARRRTLQKQ
jgi:hypothetical protein